VAAGASAWEPESARYKRAATTPTAQDAQGIAPEGWELFKTAQHRGGASATVSLIWSAGRLRPADRMAMNTKKEEKVTVTLPGVVEKIIPPIVPSVPERAQIKVQQADHLYKELRIDNALTDTDGNKVGLKVGAEVDLKIEADPKDIKPVEK
jgi:hypothetical protein